MIKENEVIKIGVFNKPHGIKGEISFTFTSDIFDRVDCAYVVCPIDGILVPFFVRSYRFRSHDRALVTLEDVTTAEKAAMFTNLEVFFPAKYFEDEEQEETLTWEMFEGFEVIDEVQGAIGTITEVDESTENTLFVIDYEGEELLLPAQEEFIRQVDVKNRQLRVAVPEGLLQLEEEEED